MFGFVRALKSTRFIPKQNVLTQRFYITSTSAKSRVGAVYTPRYISFFTSRRVRPGGVLEESVFVMAFISIAVLGPAGWILSNSCDSYRKQP